jgi:copper(I)-binding protein
MFILVLVLSACSSARPTDTAALTTATAIPTEPVMTPITATEVMAATAMPAAETPVSGTPTTGAAAQTNQGIAIRDPWVHPPMDAIAITPGAGQGQMPGQGPGQGQMPGQGQGQSRGQGPGQGRGQGPGQRDGLLAGPDTSSLFMTLVNQNSTPVALTGVSTDVAGTVQLAQIQPVQQIQPVEQIEVPANGQIEIAPGPGYQMLLLDLTRELQLDEMLNFTLTFQDGSTIEISAPVRMPMS